MKNEQTKAGSFAAAKLQAKRIWRLAALAAVIGSSMLALSLTGCGEETTGTAPAITTATLPNGTVGTPYNQTLTAGGDTPITWSLENGALPTGLNLLGSGAISGTPITAGTSSFTVKAANAAGSGTKALSITITTSSGDDPLSGTFTLTGIPSTYNGKYAFFSDSSNPVQVVGFQSATTETVTLSSISGGRATIPLWNNSGNYNVRYTGNGSFICGVSIYNSQSLLETSEEIGTLVFLTPVAFSNGSAARAWSDGIYVPKGDTIPTAYSLDGVWYRGGTVVNINGSTGVYTQFDSDNALWQSAVDKGYLNIGSQHFRNLTKTGDLTWTGQNLQILESNSAPNVATGTTWGNCTITLNANGLTFQNTSADGSGTSTITWTKVNTSLNGVWQDSAGFIATISGSTGVFTQLGSLNALSALWQDAVNKGYISIGGQNFRNLTKTGDLTWTGQVRTVTWNSSAPNVATGTDWANCTITMNANGLTFQETTTGGTITWTRQ